MKNFFKLFYVVAICSFSSNLYAQPKFIKDSLDSYILRGMNDWQIPGLSIVVVKDGKIVTMKGYGTRSIDENEPVDENTLFMIASNTKLFTGTALAQLEYNKKLSLNDKITKYFSDYELYEKTSTELVTIKDMLCHRLGTKTFQGDFTFFNGNLSRSQILYKMRFLKPTGLFRQDYGYCNSCFLTAGEIIPLVSGKPWEVYIYDSLLAPLEMKNSLPLSRGIAHSANAAKAHTNVYTGKLSVLPYDAWDNLAPAASIVSNVNDLSHWLLMQLDSGKYNNQQILPWQVLQKTRDINIVTGSRKSSLYPTHIRGYGLGIFNGDYNGKQIYFHTGGASGMVSIIGFVPEENLGIAILTNNDNQNFFTALYYQVLDAYLGVKYVNRSLQQLKYFIPENNKQIADVNALKARLKNNKPQLPLDNFTGVYKNELYGNIEISKKEDCLFIKFKGHDNLTATVKYLDNEEWLLEYNNILWGIFPIKFKIENGFVKTIDIKMNDFIESDAYTFEKE